MKSAHRFREGLRPVLGIGPHAFTKTKREPWETGLGVAIEADGYARRTLALELEDFVGDGDRFRRTEGVVLRKKLP